jgi:hypothetical protein
LDSIKGPDGTVLEYEMEDTMHNWWDCYLAVSERLLQECPVQPLMTCLSVSVCLRDQTFVEIDMRN